MISREKSPKWNTIDTRCSINKKDYRDADKLPSWEVLDVSLNGKLQRYDSVHGDLNSTEKSNIDYFVTANEKKETIKYF